MTIIYKGTLPREFIETVGGRDEDMLDFLIGHWDVVDAYKLGLRFQVILGQEDFITQNVECQVRLLGDGKHATFWLLTYQAKWR